MQPLELFTICLSPTKKIELSFVGKNLGLNSGDTVTVSKDGVAAAFKLGNFIHKGEVGGGSLVAAQTETLYVFQARIVKTSYFVIMAFAGGEMRHFFTSVFLTPAAAFAKLEQAKEEAKTLGIEGFDTIGVFEIRPSLRDWDFAKRILPIAAPTCGPQLITQNIPVRNWSDWLASFSDAITTGRPRCSALRDPYSQPTHS